MTGSERRDRPSLTGQRVLVTGAGGFVGRHLVAALALEGAQVDKITRNECDLTDAAALADRVGRARPDIVMHLAATRRAASAADRAKTVEVNALSGMRVVEAVPDTCRTVVRLGSSTEYGASPRPMDENTALRPRGFFGATKAAGSLLFAAAAELRGLRACDLRAFQVYGPDDKPDRLVPVVLEAARTSRVVPLTATGMRRDWVWVGDVVAACVSAAVRDDLPSHTTFNLGTGIQTSNEELVAAAERATGRRIHTRIGAHPGRSWDTDSWVCDPTAARVELGWKAEVDLQEGLRRCWMAR